MDEDDLVSYHHRQVVAPPGGSRVESCDAENGNGVGDAVTGGDDLATDTGVKHDGSDNLPGECRFLGVFRSVFFYILAAYLASRSLPTP